MVVAMNFTEFQYNLYFCLREVAWKRENREITIEESLQMQKDICIRFIREVKIIEDSPPSNKTSWAKVTKEMC